MARYPRSFAERNKVVIAVVGLLVLSVAFALAMNAQSLPVIGAGPAHTAYFKEAGGLKKGNEVRVAGIKVGKVTGIALEGAKVKVTFRAKGVRLGDQTAASVEVKTLLGRKFLALQPAGPGALDAPIPVSRTTTPYDVTAAFEDLSGTLDEIDTGQLAESLDVLSKTFAKTPGDVHAMLTGLTALSRTISSRDDQLQRLFAETRRVTTVVTDNDQQIGEIVDRGDQLLTELAARRKAVHALLVGTQRLGAQVRGLIKDNQRQLTPALTRLDKVADILSTNQQHLDTSLKTIAPYYRMLTSTMATGPWVDAYLCGLFDDKDAPELDPNDLRNCHPGGAK